MRHGKPRFGDLIFEVNCLGCGEVAYSLPYRENTHHTMTCHRCGEITIAHVLPGMHLAVATAEQRAVALARLAADVEAALARGRIRLRERLKERHCTLASASDDNTIRLWNPHTGEHQRTLKGHTDWVRAIAFSPDGTTLASASSDKTIRLWSLNTGEHQRTLTGHTDDVNAIAFSPDGTSLACNPDSTTIRIWNPHTDQHQNTLTGHKHRVFAVAYSPDGATLASASGDNTVRLWNPHTGQHLHFLTGHTRDVNAVAFEPGGRPGRDAVVEPPLTTVDRGDGWVRLTMTDTAEFICAYDLYRVRLAPGAVEVTVKVDIRCQGLHARVALGALSARVIWADGTVRDASAIEDLTFEVAWVKAPRLPLVEGVLPLQRTSRDGSAESDREGEGA